MVVAVGKSDAACRVTGSKSTISWCWFLDLKKRVIDAFYRPIHCSREQKAAGYVGLDIGCTDLLLVPKAIGSVYAGPVKFS